jgi:hypothetical protein
MKLEGQTEPVLRIRIRKFSRELDHVQESVLCESECQTEPVLWIRKFCRESDLVQESVRYESEGQTEPVLWIRIRKFRHDSDPIVYRNMCDINLESRLNPLLIQPNHSPIQESVRHEPGGLRT